MARALSEEQREKNRVRSAAWAAANREKAKERARAWYEANRERGRATGRAYAAANRESERRRASAHYYANRDNILAASVSRPKDDPTRERDRARTSAWAAANAERKRLAGEKAYHANRDRRLEAAKAYRAANPGKMRAMSARKKASKAHRTPPWLTADDWKQIRSFYDEAVRLTRETGEPWHVDHIIPLRGKLVSGLHVPRNLQVLRGEENMKKKNKFDPDAFGANLLTLA